jgi:hypothetical protein
MFENMIMPLRTCRKSLLAGIALFCLLLNLGTDIVIADEAPGFGKLPAVPYDDLPKNRYCGAKALTLWECALPKQTLVLCLAQQGAGAARLAVRKIDSAGKEYRIVDGGQPGVRLQYESDPNGDASLSFIGPKRELTLIDPLRGDSLYEQTEDGKTRRYACRNPNQTLSLNYTQALMQTLSNSR